MALAHVSWELGPGENWAVTGGNGAGKSTFLSLVRGDIWPTQNMGRRLYFDRQGNSSLSPIGFRERTTFISAELIDHYLLLERIIDAKTLLMAGLRNTPLVYAPPTTEEWAEVHALAERMGVSELLDKPLPECSTGQLKRLFLARAMACKPDILFLDEYADGLDQSSRKEVMDLMNRMAESGVQILCAAHRESELPACVSHVLMLEKGRVVYAGARTGNGSGGRESYAKVNPVSSEFSENSAGLGIHGTGPEDIPQVAAMDFSLLPAPGRVSASVSVLSLANATAGIDGTVIVRDVNLIVRAGERWMLTGENGAGKSTLLRMMAGELPAAYGGEVRWFGQGRMPSGEGYENFQDIRRRMGLVTPQLQTAHHRKISVLDVVLSGFQQHIGLHEPPTPAMEQAASDTLAALGIASLAGREADTLSYGQLRKVLFARALVHGPCLLILDEPFSGLDTPSRRDMRAILNGLADQGLTMVLATHHPEESGSWATHTALIDHGTLTVLRD